MNNQEILDNAPEGATHVELLTDYRKIYYYRRKYKDFCNKFMYDVYQQGTWYICSDISGEFRSLADIKRIIELENLTQMIIDAESADGSLITIMYHAWLHKAKALKKQE